MEFIQIIVGIIYEDFVRSQLGLNTEHYRHLRDILTPFNFPLINNQLIGERPTTEPELSKKIEATIIAKDPLVCQICSWTAKDSNEFDIHIVKKHQSR